MTDRELQQLRNLLEKAASATNTRLTMHRSGFLAALDVVQDELEERDAAWDDARA